MHEQGEKHKGIRPLPGLDFQSGLIQRISFVNGLIHEQEERIRQAKGADVAYERYLIEIFSEEKGALATEGLIYQATPTNHPFFTVYEEPTQSLPGIKPSQEIVGLRYNVPGSNSKVYNTKVESRTLRLPGTVDSHEDLAWLLHRQPPMLSTEELQHVGQTLEDLSFQIKEAERAGNYNLGRTLKAEKDQLLLETVLPAGQGFLTRDCRIKVALEQRGPTRNEILDINIKAGGERYQIHLTLPKDRAEREKFMEAVGGNVKVRRFNR